MAVNLDKVTDEISNLTLMEVAQLVKQLEEKALLENLGALMDAVVKAKPSGSKGAYIKSITLTSTMGPGVSLDVGQAQALASAS